MSRVELDFPGWSQSGETWARGYAHLDGRVLDADGLAEALDACASDPEWTKVIAGLNGCFAAVSSRGSRVRAAVDRVRSIPLFYVVANGDVYLSDSAYRVMESSGVRQMDTMADIEFCLTGYVTGTATLCTGIHQIEAGEVVCLDSAATPTSERRRYFEFRHRNFCTAHVDELISELEGVHARVFTRLLESTRGRTVAVPLSGGYDSRLVGVSLRDLGLRDVICYSYGVPGNWESRISQELARYLGFRWEFVPYSADRWRTWAATDQFRQYFHAAGNLTSVPHIQDWPALFELRREARIPPGTVFVPGHSGDFVAGSHIPRSFAGRSRISRRETLDALQRAHYSLWDWPPDRRRELRDEFDRRVEAAIGPITDETPEGAADAFERWDLQERQAKFICNSVRVYEDFGYEWRLPLFDNELLHFWSRIPVNLRVGRRLYFDFARQRQALPITGANADHGTIVNLIIRGMDIGGLRPAARRIRRVARKLRWRATYEGSPLAWLELVDREQFRRTYTGKELMHSYLALRYRDHAAQVITGQRRD